MNVQSLTKILHAFKPTPQELANAWFATCLILGILCVLVGASMVTDWLADRVVARFWREAR